MPSKGFLPILLILVVSVLGIVIVAFIKFLSPSYVPPQLTAPADQQIKDLGQLSDSDEINAIESELSSTNVETLDSGLDEEIQAAGL